MRYTLQGYDFRLSMLAAVGRIYESGPVSGEYAFCVELNVKYEDHAFTNHYDNEKLAKQDRKKLIAAWDEYMDRHDSVCEQHIDEEALKARMSDDVVDIFIPKQPRRKWVVTKETPETPEMTYNGLLSDLKEAAQMLGDIGADDTIALSYHAANRYTINVLENIIAKHEKTKEN